METLHPDAALLLAYVDKQLSPEEIVVAEKIIADDPEAKALVNTLANTELPFAEAFEFLFLVWSLVTQVFHLNWPIKSHH